MIPIGRVPALVVVHEVLADGGACHGRNVLHGGRIRSSRGDDDRLVEDALARKGLLDGGDSRRLLADGDVDADHVCVALVHDGVDGDGGLARLAVTDDELALATADGDHGVDGDEPGLDGLAHRLALHDARGLELDGATSVGVDGTQPVDGLAERVHDAPQHGVAHRDVHDTTRSAALITLFDGIHLAKQDRANLVDIEVLRKAKDAAPASGTRELQELTGHGGLEAGDVGDAVANLGDDRCLLVVDRRVDLSEALAQGAHDLRRTNLVCHCSSLPTKVEASVLRMLASCARTDASKRLPYASITIPPKMEGSTLSTR